MHIFTRAVSNMEEPVSNDIIKFYMRYKDGPGNWATKLKYNHGHV